MAGCLVPQLHPVMLIASFIVYLILVAGIGYRAWQQTQTVDDYLLGGRRVGASVAALSAGASDMSGWLLLGLPGLAVLNPTAACVTALGLLLGTWCNWRFVAARLRQGSAALEALTLPDYFARRFPAHGRTLRALSASAIVIFFLLYTSAGLVACGKLFHASFGIGYESSVLLGAAIVLTYTLFGGFLAVTWTDALQALIMLAALLLVGFTLQTTEARPAHLADSLNTVTPVAGLSALAWGLGYCGQPHVLTRFMALHPSASVHRARRLGTSWAGFGLAAAILVGMGGADLVAIGGDPEQVFIRAVEVVLPPALAGFCLAAILAAIMSTADSQLLVTASALSEDLRSLWGTSRESVDRGGIRQGRIAVLAVSLGATVLALDPGAAVFDLVARAWAGFGATFGPAVLISLYRDDASGAGALWGMLTGLVTVVAWPWLPHHGFGIYELLPAFGLSLGVNRLVCASLARYGKTA